MITNLPHNSPALEILKNEGISPVTERSSPVAECSSPVAERSRSVKIAILNLMPLKIATEADFIRLLSNSPLEIELDFIRLETHISKNVSEAHLNEFYKPFSTIKNSTYDGCIITGAPVELLPFEEVTYWHELTEIFNWARTNVTSSFYICWGAQAALYHFYGIEKHTLDKKLFGVFRHTVNEPEFPLFRGFDDSFFAPHSRHTTIYADDIKKCSELTILSESDEAGIYLVSSRNGRDIYATGHSEYHALTLHEEYIRDMAKGLDSVEMPQHYYPNNNPNNCPAVVWRAHANLMFSNWLNWFVKNQFTAPCTQYC
jgi:homoserine O-succinyltransferase